MTMSTCCNDSANTTPSNATLTVALAGNPNSGKTTIFNALTGLRQKVANYPGVTVEKKTGRFKTADGRWINVVDLPGTYSLISRSPDEQVAMEVLRGLRKDTPAPDVVVVVVDASNLQRNLYLVSQLIETGRPLVVALNMMDVAERRGIHVSPAALSKQLGAMVIPVVGHKKQGIAELKAAVLHARIAPLPKFPLPEAMKEELLLVGGGLAILDSEDGEAKDEGRRMKDEGGSDASFILHPSSFPTTPPNPLPAGEGTGGARLDHYQAIAERLLTGDRAADINHYATRQPVASLLKSSSARLAALGIDPMQADIEAHYRWIDDIASAVTTSRGLGVPPEHSFKSEKRLGRDAQATDKATLLYETPARNLTESIDRILIHKVWGLTIFVAIMAALFVMIFWVADPMMGAMESAVGWLGDLVTPLLPEGPVKDLWSDGIVAGVGGVVVFVPQIAMLFLFLAIMEDSGYLARAAFLMDRLLSKVGLHGKSFIPLLSSFACAIPGIMATRTIEDRKDRLATIFVAPFMSCSARLPVYFLLIGTFFATFSPAARGGIMALCYLLGIVAAAGTAWIFKRSMLKGTRPAFILEMPTYKFPQPGQILRTVWTNTYAFLAKAGTIIFVLSVILWAMAYYPRLPGSREIEIRQQVKLQNQQARTELEAQWDMIGQQTGEAVKGFYFEGVDVEQAVASAQLRHSISGRLGHFIEPVLKPLGYDWKMGVGLIAAFAAREVFVSHMGIVYSVGESEDDTTDLSTAMMSDTYADGRRVWTPLVAVSLLAWFVLAMQCMSTLAIVKRETGGWKWAIAMLVYMNGLAYLVSLAIYQVGRIWFA